ncbi:MAG: hypothetical protein WCI73_08620 [Phycisphaerae bacterium]
MLPLEPKKNQTPRFAANSLPLGPDYSVVQLQADGTLYVLANRRIGSAIIRLRLQLSAEHPAETLGIIDGDGVHYIIERDGDTRLELVPDSLPMFAGDECPICDALHRSSDAEGK